MRLLLMEDNRFCLFFNIVVRKDKKYYLGCFKVRQYIARPYENWFGWLSRLAQ